MRSTSHTAQPVGREVEVDAAEPSGARDLRQRRGLREVAHRTRLHVPQERLPALGHDIQGLLHAAVE